MLALLRRGLFLCLCLVVLESNASQGCNRNEEWMTCSSCEQGCGERPKACSRVCGPPACVCPRHKGFLRDTFGNCIRHWECTRPRRTTPRPYDTTTITPWYRIRTCGHTYCPPGLVCEMRTMRCPRGRGCPQRPTCVSRY